MSTMLEDYRNMDVRNADVSKGLKLVFGNAEAKTLEKSCASASASPRPIVADPPIIPPLIVLNPLLDFTALGSVRLWKIGRRVKNYNRRWADVSENEKRDVVAALRLATKTAKYAVLAAKLLVWLA